MIQAIFTDSSHVLIFAKDPAYTGGINALYAKKKNTENFEFWSFFEINKELFEFYSSLNSHIPVYVFTTGTIQNAPELRSLYQNSFVDVFSANKLGISKKDSSSYLALCEKIHVDPEKVLYIDDKQEHVDVAKQAGLVAFQHVSNDETLKKIESLEISN